MRCSPWLVQRTKKIFDESHHDIFARPAVTAGRIVVLFELYKEIERDLDKIEPRLFCGYQITKFFLLYLIAEVLINDELGKNFCKSPENFCQTDTQKSNFFNCVVHTVVEDLIIDLNAEFEERGGENFDFKTTFKSANLLRSLKDAVITAYKKIINRGRTESFSQLWSTLNQEHQE